MAKTFFPPKGTRDFLPDEMRVRAAVFDRLRRSFQLFGYDELDTPAFESLEVLILKAGPGAEKEIYSFDDKGGRRLGLRFDLTSSTGRVAAAHPELRRPIYRYQIGKVWRYDRPAAGRYREFYQADADILGSYSMDCEVDLLLLATHVLAEFGLSDYELALNNRKVLEAQVRRAGIPAEKKADALRALDKLEKIGRAAVVKEAVEIYGIPLAPFIALLDQLAGARDGMSYLAQTEARLAADEDGVTGVRELRHVWTRAQELGFAARLRIDPTLARGLDYYTGPIFEAKARIGERLMSFAGGGRYDDLIGLYGGQPQGAVGFSFGVERLIDLLKERGTVFAGERPLLVAPIGTDRGGDASRVAMVLRQAGIAVRLSLNATAPSKHLQYAEAVGIDRVVFVGEQEVKEGRYPLKILSLRSEERLDLAGLIVRLRPC